ASAEPVAVAVPVPDAALIIDRPETPVVVPPEFLDDPLAAPGYTAPAPANIPPAPAYVPPAPPPNFLPPPPAPPYVPPVFPAGEMPTASALQEPRLRDRIIERIPVLNRFHEPEPYGQ
ncbi:MAG: DUF7157 domain-containing protein, partial [Mycobacterium sp.]